MAEMTARDIKRELQISDVTLWRWRKEGMPHNKYGYKTIRYDLQEVKKWLRETKGID